jgi:hypothetical protein
MRFANGPFRVHVRPLSDGRKMVNSVADGMRVELLRSIGLQDLLTLGYVAVESQNPDPGGKELSVAVFR